jgi:DNA mismatch endonuclease (patch repair protein)
MDVLTPQQRSFNMSRIGGRNTRQELLLRKALFARGFRYRLHRRDLPDTPDLVFPRFGAVVFVHGCFWHGHGCHLFVLPEQNRAFWRQKIALNQDRDKRAQVKLCNLGWRVLTVWECALRGRQRKSPDELAVEVGRWLEG